jgi:hypothetical protein
MKENKIKLKRKGGQKTDDDGLITAYLAVRLLVEFEQKCIDACSQDCVVASSGKGVRRLSVFNLVISRN